MTESKTLDKLHGLHGHGEVTEVIYVMQDGSRWSIKEESLATWRRAVGDAEFATRKTGVQQRLSKVSLTRSE